MNFFHVDKLGIRLELSGVYSLVSIENVMINGVYQLLFPSPYSISFLIEFENQ